MLATSPLDGCPAFDERLLESAFAPSPDAELDRHLAACARCRLARDRYLATAEAIAACALATPDAISAPARGPAPRASSSRRSRVERAALVAAACAIAAAVLAWWPRASPQALAFELTGSANEVSVDAETGDVRLASGGGRFTFTGPARVTTPIGAVRAESATVEIAVARRDEADMDGRTKTGLGVTVAVLAGTAWWIASDGSEVELGPGASLARESDASPRPEPGASTALGVSAAVPADRPAARSSAADTTRPTSLDELDTVVLTGRVLDARTRRPVPGADVWFAVRWNLAAGDSAWEGTAHTDADGTFALAAPKATAPSSAARALVDGDPRLVVREPSHAPLVVGGPARGGPLAVERLFAPIAVGELLLARGTALAGVVLDAADRPVPGARLFRMRSSDEATFALADGMQVGTSDAAGRIVLDATLGASDTGTRTLLVALDEREPTSLGWCVLDVLAGRDRLDDVVVRVPAHAELVVVARDERGAPIAGVDVTAAPRFAPFGRFVPGEVPRVPYLEGVRELRATFLCRTDAAGRARFASLPCPDAPAVYAVAASAEGRTTSYLPIVHVAASGGGDSQLVEIVVPALAPIELSGRVVDAAGAPIAGAELVLRDQREPADATDATGAPGAPDRDPAALEFGRATTRADGSFVLVATPDARAPDWLSVLWLEARRAGYARGLALLEHSTPEQRTSIEIVLEQAHPIGGVVVDETGTPVPGVELWGEQGDRVLRETRTGADGRFRFDDGGRGRCRVWLRPPDPATAWSAPEEVELTPGDDARIVLARERRTYARVVVRVLDAETGAPLDPVAAMLLPVRNGDGASTSEARRSSGEVRWDEVVEGEHDAWVLVDGRPMATLRVRVGAGATEVREELRVGRHGGLDVRIDFGTRTPESVRVHAERVVTGRGPGGIRWAQSGRSAVERTSADDPTALAGPLSFDELVPGTWWVWFEGKTTLGGAEVSVPASGRATLTIAAELPGFAVFRADPPPPGDGAWLVVDIEAVAGRWPRRMLATPTKEASSRPSLATEQLLAPGRHRWRAAFAREDDAGNLEETSAAVTGEIDVRTGERVEVAVPFRPR